MKNGELIMTLQSCLLKLAQAYLETKGHNKPLTSAKEEFSIYNKKFTALIAKLPLEFYSDEISSNKYIDEAKELISFINEKIEYLRKPNTNN